MLVIVAVAMHMIMGRVMNSPGELMGDVFTAIMGRTATLVTDHYVMGHFNQGTCREWKDKMKIKFRAFKHQVTITARLVVHPDPDPPDCPECGARLFKGAHWTGDGWLLQFMCPNYDEFNQFDDFMIEWPEAWGAMTPQDLEDEGFTII